MPSCCPMPALLGGLPGPSEGASRMASWFALLVGLLGASWGAGPGLLAMGPGAGLPGGRPPGAGGAEPPGVRAPRGAPGPSALFWGFGLRRKERNGGLLARPHPLGAVVFQLHASHHQVSSNSLFTDMPLAHFPCD